MRHRLKLAHPIANIGVDRDAVAEVLIEDKIGAVSGLLRQNVQALAVIVEIALTGDEVTRAQAFAILPTGDGVGGDIAAGCGVEDDDVAGVAEDATPVGASEPPQVRVVRPVPLGCRQAAAVIVFIGAQDRA